ncbi:MAG: hypothetical protein RQ739_00130 [Desulfotignum sp.]|nr:hypothetical protein [Desulfotignum sp.]
MISYLSTPYAPFLSDIGGTMPVIPGYVWKDVTLTGTLVHEPDLLIVKEPTSTLDPSVQTKVFLNLQIEKGLTLLFVTHNIGLARKVADRIGVMSGGRIIETGPAARIVNHPGHEYTRALIHSARGLNPLRPAVSSPL